MSRKILRDDETAEKQETTQTQETTKELQEKLKCVKESVYSVKELSANSKNGLNLTCLLQMTQGFGVLPA